MSKNIVVRKANEHNLKNVNVNIPKNSLVVITGVSGSGKSSLAFDTIYQEGQKKYLDSLSSYARQFIGEMKSPDVESIRGITPTISIDQKTINRNPRSTVGTITELFDHFRILFSRLGTPHCHGCGEVITAQSVSQITQNLVVDNPSSKLIIMAPIIIDRKGEYRKDLEDLKAQGFTRVRVDGTIYSLDDKIELERYEKHTIEIVIDRLVVDKKHVARIIESIETALNFSRPLVSFLIEDKYVLQSTDLACAKCNISIPELEPRLFSFNAVQGQCSHCQGLGELREFNPSLVIPDSTQSINEGCIKVMTQNGNVMFSHYGLQELQILAKEYKFSLNTAWKDYTKKQKEIILFGSDKELKFKLRRPSKRGHKILEEHRKIRGVLEVAQRVWDRWHPSLMHKYMDTQICSHCNGQRLNASALNVFFRKKNIIEACQLSIEECFQFFEELALSAREKEIGDELFKEIQYRLKYLRDVGLGYLTLDRSAATLSGGEAQRIRLASQVGSNLQGVTYILDEPSIGLHPRDNDKLLDTLQSLKKQGNSLIVVEHDEDTMIAADTIIDIGPKAGINGGKILAQGPLHELLENKKSLTGQYLSNQISIDANPTLREQTEHKILIENIHKHNLKNISVEIPMDMLVVVTGISGSGKSTLIHRVVSKHVHHHLTGNAKPETAAGQMVQVPDVQTLVEITQDPIGKTSRSNPATYTKVFDLIRDLFAGLPESKIRGYAKGRFSFNVATGRCENCEGSGSIEIEMHLLENVVIECEECKGKRYNKATLEVHFKGKNIAEVLEMSFNQASRFFENHPKIKKIIDQVIDVGLGYLKLGQPSPTLSGGEAQRMKIASELRKQNSNKALYILDEPTTGLHFQDIKQLMSCLQNLVDKGNSMIIIEHNLDVIQCADWIIDLGPDGGKYGGEIVATGTPKHIAKNKKSLTGKYLKRYFATKKNGIKTNASKIGKVAINPNIEVKGAKKHNLKNIDVTIPQNKLTVITGLSGSGKSSLAFHTLFAEGQRRFVESMSTYARRFIGQMDRGSVESITGLPPAIAVDQKSANRSARSTIATITELYDYFRILYSHVGKLRCPTCEKPTIQYNNVSFKNHLKTEYNDKMVCILAPIQTNLPTFQLTEEFEDKNALLEKLKIHNIGRLYINDQYIHIDEAKIKKSDKVYAVLDRMKISEQKLSRLNESLEKGIEIGHNILAVEHDGKIEILPFTKACPDNHFFLQDPLEPKHFSFNSHWGACSTCAGLGVLGRKICPGCDGHKLNSTSLSVKLQDTHISDLNTKTIDECHEFFSDIPLNDQEKIIAKPLLKEIHGRLQFLVQVGLGYLNLNRTGDTLSAGESQRIRLASQIGSGLEGALYVLDEPTTGLHQRDTQMLLSTLKKLRDIGNTIVTVEHDNEFIADADHLIDLGPGAGIHGGELVAKGTPKQFKKFVKKSLTAAYLYGQRHIESILETDPALNKFIHLNNVQFRNLKDVSFKIPFEAITCISGISGSGKSTLLFECLRDRVERYINGKRVDNNKRGVLELDDKIKKLVVVDQSPIGNTPRSTPITYSKTFDKIRDLWATLPESKMKGYSKRRFSYNSGEGRCEICEGRGYHNIEMHFLSDVWEVCEACNGTRFNPATREIKYRGKSIADVLEMRISEATEFFENHSAIHRTLKTFNDIGLGYIKLGQAGNTLSGGEAQRIKLATELSKNNQANTLYLLDEPTTGLHSEDIQLLWRLLEGLVENKGTVVLVEHHMSVIKNSQYIVDLGPEGGEKGGKLLFQGTVEELKKSKVKSYTKDCLNNLA